MDGAVNVTIFACSFTDNGNVSAADNVFLGRVTHCSVTDTRLNNSPSANGVKLVDCTDVTLSGDEIARNVLYGICAVGCNQTRLEHNLIEGNETGTVSATPSGP
jgi:parallel beta-helix repeat protein